MVHQIAFARAHIGIGDGLVYGQGFGLEPLAVLIVETLLGNLTNVDFGVEVGGKSLVVVAGVAVYDVQIVYLVKVVLGSIGGIDAAHTGVETTTEDGGEASLLKLLLVSPLPAVLEVGLVLGLIVGGVQVVAATSQTGLHDGEVLIGKGQVDYQFGLEVVEESLQLLHIISIHLCCLDIGIAYSLDYLVTLFLATAGNHEISKHVGILVDLECRYRCDASGANHQYSAHFTLFYFIRFYS